MLPKSLKIIAIVLLFFSCKNLVLAQDGATLFKQNCTACHKTNKQKLVGPGLEGVTQKRSEAWLMQFIRNSQKFIQSGDAEAAAIYETFNKTLMPPFEHLSNNDIQAILTYLSGTVSAPSETSTVVEASALPLEFSDEDQKLGKLLFSGIQRFTNKGQACISCHHVSYNELIPGGLLAKDLTKAYTRLGAEGISGLLGAPPFPAMAVAYANNNLTPDEIRQLTSFLKMVDESSASQNVSSGHEILLLGGGSGLFLLLILIGISWKNRKKESVKKDIFQRQTKGKDSVVY